MPARPCTWLVDDQASGARPASSETCLLYLDFDGVICDSEQECFVSSWITYYQRLGHEPTDHVALAARSEFRALRPLIRSGEDYVFIQHLLAPRRDHGRVAPLPNEQAAFDAQRDALGAKQIAEWKRALAATREQLLRDERAYWLRQNRLYPHMQRLLAGRDLRNVRIVSTKSTDLILAILAAHDIEVAADHVFHAASNPTGRSMKKLEMIGAQLDAARDRATGQRPTALFVEDQIDHLLDGSDAGVKGYVAEWGYLLPGWRQQLPALRERGIATVNAQTVASLFDRVGA